jgi:hypothetical protein
MGFVEQSLQFVQLFKGEVSPRPPLLHFVAVSITVAWYRIRGRVLLDIDIDSFRFRLYCYEQKVSKCLKSNKQSKNFTLPRIGWGLGPSSEESSWVLSSFSLNERLDSSLTDAETSWNDTSNRYTINHLTETLWGSKMKMETRGRPLNVLYLISSSAIFPENLYCLM